MRRTVPLESWEAVMPGVVFPFLGLWLGGDAWSARGLAAAANLAPLATLAVIAFVGGRATPAVQGAATVAYTATAVGWIAATWDVPGLATAGAHAGLWTPVAAAGAGLVVYGLTALVLRLLPGTALTTRGEA